MISLAVVLGLMLAASLFIVALGLPLLIRTESLVPDMIGLGILAAGVLAYVWAFGIWWTLVPVAAILALVLWMDREPGAQPYLETGMSERTRLRFRLWAAANGTSVILLALFGLALATGVGRGILKDFAIPSLLVMAVASSAFRFSYNRSIPPDAPGAAEPPLRAA